MRAASSWPPTAVLVVARPLALAARVPLAKRAGLRVPVTPGLVMLAAGMVFFAAMAGSSGYGHYVLAMVIESAGIGLAPSAATSASMRELLPTLAGMGSAVNDTTRNMGSVPRCCRTPLGPRLRLAARGSGPGCGTGPAAVPVAEAADMQVPVLEVARS